MTDDELKELARTILYDVQRTHNSADAVRVIVDILRPYLQRRDVDKTNPTGSRFVSAADLFWLHTDTQCGEIPGSQLLQIIDACIESYMPIWPAEFREQPRIRTIQDKGGCEVSVVWPNLLSYRWLFDPQTPARDVCRFVIQQLHLLIQEHQQQENGHGDI